MSNPAVSLPTQAPAAPVIQAPVAPEAVAPELVAVTANSKPATVPTTLVPAVSDPIAAAPSAEIPLMAAPVAAPKPGLAVAAAPPAAPASAVQTAAAAAAAAAAATAAATTTSKSSSSKSKKKKGAPTTVTMATAPSAASGSQGAQGENTGRWTAEEHRLFLQGLEQHGKGWKKIASLIKSRTVVQIRTHAQKYFQKLAKARQNGEEGDVAMEGRGGTTSVSAVGGSGGAQMKRRRQTTGTKRKAISSVVSSAQRQGKKMAAAQAAAGVANPKPPLPAVAPALAPFVMPEAGSKTSTIPSITTAHGVVSGAALEESLFRFLTPAPVSDPLAVQVNDVARQAGANPITVPTEIPSNTQATTGGEISPTGVADTALLSTWTDAKDMPTWYGKGADVDCLLDVADGLDWLTDTGDLNEVYNAPAPATVSTEVPPPKADAAPQLPLASSLEKNTTPSTTALAQTSSVTSFATQDSSGVPPLPSLFSTGSDQSLLKKQVTSSSQLTEASAEGMGEDLDVFDTPMEEHAFVSALLGNTGESSGSLPALG